MARVEAAMGAQRTTLEAAIAALAAAIEVQRTAIDPLGGDVSTRQEELERRVDALEASVDDVPRSRLMIVPLREGGPAQAPIQ